MKPRLHEILIAVPALCIAGCFAGVPVRTEQMQGLGSALTKLSAAVEATARYDDLPGTISDEELLMRATKHDPGLIEPFKDYSLRVNREHRHAVVLVCTRDRHVGLLEDAGCTAPMDKHLWQVSPPVPCEFTLQLADVCRDPG